MTQKEFEEFLASVQLKSGHTGEVILSADFFEFSDGWLAITKSLIEDLIALGWDKQLYQAKEKFGGGRFYIGGATKEIFERIMKWERDSIQICEVCGKEGKLRGDRSWIQTLCDEHAK